MLSEQNTSVKYEYLAGLQVEMENVPLISVFGRHCWAFTNTRGIHEYERHLGIIRERFRNSAYLEAELGLAGPEPLQRD